MSDYDKYVPDNDVESFDYPYLTAKDGTEYFIIAADANGYYCNNA